MSTSAEGRLVRPLYRALIRLAGAFDREPAAKLMIYAKQTNEKSLYNAAVSEFLGGNHRFYLAPGSEARVTDVVKKFFRLPLTEGSTVDERVDAAFLAVRELSTVWHQALTHIVSPRLKQRRDEAQAAWLEQEEEQTQEEQTPLKLSKAPQLQAEESVTPFPVKEAKSLAAGVMLLAHPLIAGSIFQRSVILLVEHHSSRDEGDGASEEGTPRMSRKGSYGLIINKLSGFDLKHAVKGGLKPDFYKAFAASPVRLGGPVPRLQMLHRQERVGGVAVEGQDDKLMVSGDVDQASGLVLSGDVPAEDFNFFAGACTWAPGQLDEEIEKGYWILVEAPPAVSVEFRPQLWREMLLGLGGRYKLSANLPESVLPRLVEPPSRSS